MKRPFFNALAIIYAGAMFMAASEPQPPRALSLEVEEGAGAVAIHLVAQSPVRQKVAYTATLTGSSRSRHSGATTIPAGERQVLSRMRTAFVDGWCAEVEVEEETGAPYRLTAGDCADG